MKKYKFLITILVSFIVAVSGVNASNITNKININDYLGGITNYTKTYNKGQDINDVVITLNISEKLIDTVLNQAPGNSSSAASLGGFYIEMDPKLDIAGYTFSKANRYYAKETDLDSVKKNVNDDIIKNIDNNDLSNTSKVWPFGIMIHYYKDGKWNGIYDESNGGKTIKANLIEKLGITNEKDLIYGVNYRLFMYTNYNWLYGFQAVKDGKKVGNTEYINVSYKINYPVQGIVNGGVVYYPSLDNALKAGAKDIIIKEEDNSNIVKSNYFSSLKASGSNLTLSQKNNELIIYTWTFDGSKITDENINVNTNITFTLEAPEGIKNDVNKETINHKNVSFINFEHSGKLPGIAEVTYYVLDKYNIGTKLFVAHFNETTKKLENIQETEVDNNGYIKFNVGECSSYVLYTSIGNNGSITTETIENVQTGDINLYKIIGLLIISFIGILITFKKILVKKN